MKKIRQTKQVILVRTDIKMPPGKLAAQVAHASLGVFTKMFDRVSDEVVEVYIDNPSPVQTWLDHSFTKVCLNVSSLEEMDDLYVEAKRRGIPNCRIIDDGRTIFNNTPTVTCCAIGPWWSDELTEITGHLRLL